MPSVSRETRAKLTVNGVAYEGWKAVTIALSIEAICGTFELTVSERFPLQNIPWPILEGDECSVSIGDTTLITGFVDKRRLGFSPEAHALGVSGRDRTCDLVDCGVNLGKWELANLKADAIVRKIAAQFSIDVSLAPGVTVPAARDRFALNPGETAFEAIDRICRLSGLLPVSDGEGGLILTRTGTTQCVTALVQGQNILEAGGDFDSTKRFRKIIVRGSGAGSDDASGETVAAVTAEATDAGARAGRVLVIRGDSHLTTAQARDRANWEAAVRAARGGRANVKVQGWTQGDGSLWPLNSIAHLQSTWLGIDADMLVAGITFSLDQDSGTTTQLTLMRPDAFKPQPVVPKKTDVWSEDA